MSGYTFAKHNSVGFFSYQDTRSYVVNSAIFGWEFHLETLKQKANTVNIFFRRLSILRLPSTLGLEVFGRLGYSEASHLVQAWSARKHPQLCLAFEAVLP